ncbi:MAG: hypothetical protein HRU09_15010 [Oligoflexales bacterium]|nr:hypothetical protein [Oligoflexales bacterium]
MVKLKATRRGVILIEPYKQLRFGLTFLIINLVFSILVFGVFGYYLWDIYESLSIYFQLDKSESFITLAKIGKPAIIGLVLIICFIATTLFISARYTHQIYGPMVSILRFLDDLLEGKKPSPIQLRSSDQLQDLANKLNQLTQKPIEKFEGGGEHSKKQILEGINDLIEGKDFKKLKLPANDQYAEVAGKLEQLAQKIQQ